MRERKQKLGMLVALEGRILPFVRTAVMEDTDQEPPPAAEYDGRQLILDHAWRCVLHAE